MPATRAFMRTEMRTTAVRVTSLLVLDGSKASVTLPYMV